MHRHFLLTVSDDRSALFGVRFVNAFFKNKDKIKFTLLYIAPRTGRQDTMVPVASESDTCDLVLQETVKRLIDWDFPEENLLCKVKKRMVSTSKDIIAEDNKGLYDAVILGRRGVSRLEELISDSVSIQMLEQERSAPLWICRHPDPKRQNVLICLDGSQESLHITDHAGFVLAGEDSHSLTLLNVRQDSVDPDPLFQEARQVLANYDISGDRIKQKVLDSQNPAKAILAEADKGHYSAVAVGYSGLGKKGLFKLGSVSLKLFYEIQGSALWIG
ncbi:MAG: universal stress protein [Desulfohalobiaceae bacterium]|nr:universal stress protein [Desulfohalobiaceae bacterium]